MKTKEKFHLAKEIFADVCKCFFFPRRVIEETEGKSMEEFAKECAEREAAVFYASQKSVEDRYTGDKADKKSFLSLLFFI